VYSYPLIQCAILANHELVYKDAPREQQSTVTGSMFTWLHNYIQVFILRSGFSINFAGSLCTAYVLTCKTYMGMGEKHFLTYLSNETSIVLSEYMSLMCTVHDLWLSLQPPACAGSSLADFSSLKREAIHSSKTSVYTRSTRQHPRRQHSS
jgi:hypothetical protein